MAILYYNVFGVERTSVPSTGCQTRVVQPV